MYNTNRNPSFLIPLLCAFPITWRSPVNIADVYIGRQLYCLGYSIGRIFMPFAYEGSRTAMMKSLSFSFRVFT